MPALRPLEPGDPRHLARYRLVGQLGEGGQGAVYLAEGPGGEPVAVKLLHARMVGDAQARTRFAREVSAARRVGEFCTARVLAADVDGDIPYLVSEYIEGDSLHDAVRQDGPMSGADLDRLAIGMATALTAIHRAGIIHRDFKPANVLLSPNGPKVVDFGIARALDTASTLTSQIIGTPAYMAPEQLRTGVVGPAADVFAWACTLVFAATGNPPFGNDSVPAVIKRITRDPPRLDGLTGELAETAAICLAKDPAARPTAERLLLRLLGRPARTLEIPEATQAADATLVAGSRAAAAPRTRPVPRPPSPTLLSPPAEQRPATRGPTRRRVLTGAGVLAAVTVAGGAALAASMAGKRDDKTQGAQTAGAQTGDDLTLWHRTLANTQVDALALASDTLFAQDVKGGRLFALDAYSGRQRWAWDLQTQFIAAAGSILYVADAENLYAIDGATGRRRWTLAASLDRFVIAGDVLAAADRTSDGAVMYAVNAADGQRRWTHTFHQPDSNLAPDPKKVSATPQVTVIAGETTVYALSTATGRALWRFTSKGQNLAGPLAAGNTVYVANGDHSDSGTFWALEGTTGRIRWKSSLGHTLLSSFVANADTVYVDSPESDGMRALDARSGGKRWQCAVGFSPHAVIGDTVYCDGAYSGIEAVDAATGRARWERPAANPGQQDLMFGTASEKAVFITVGPSDLYALRAH